MKHKFLVIGVAFSMLLFCFIGIKTYAQNLEPLPLTTVNPSCSFQNISSCDRNDLIMLLIQLILQRVNDPVVETKLPDLHVGSIQYMEGVMKIKIMNQGRAIDLCKEDIEIFITNSTNKTSLVTSAPYLVACENGKQLLVDINNPYVFSQSVGENLKITDGHQLNVKLDPNNRIKEANENNNELEIKLTTYSTNEKKILSPTAGATLCAKNSIDIKWQGEKNTLYRAFIEKADKSKTWEFAFSDITTDGNGIGTYTWKYIGEEFNDNNKYRIYVKPQTTNVLKDDIISVDNITVSDCSKETAKINITFPTENDVLTVGKTYTIKWKSQNLTGNRINIFGNKNSLITTLPITATSYTWTVPESYGGANTGVIWVGSDKGGVWEKIVNVQFKVNKYDLQKYGKFSAKEIVEDNLPNDITFWAEAFCPNFNTNANYAIPEGYELVSCEMGETGTHGGCSYCAMSKIKLKAKTNDLPNLNIKDVSYYDSYIAIEYCNDSNVALKVAPEIKITNLKTNQSRTFTTSAPSPGQCLGKNDTGNPASMIGLKSNEYVQVKVEIDPNNKIEEANENDNVLTKYIGEEDINKTILYPTADVRLCEGKQVTIKWQGEKDTKHLITVESEDGSGGHLSYSAKTDSQGLGQFVWNVDSSSGRYRIHMESQDALNRYSIDSDYFTISNCGGNDIACPALYDPVCGKDGRTYSNSCQAGKAGTEVAYKGECGSSTTSKPIPCERYGDVDQDGEITNGDVTAANDKINDPNVDLSLIDVDGNKEAGFNDIVLINSYLTGKISTFPVCPIMTIDDFSGSVTEKGNPFQIVKDLIKSIFK